MTQESFRVLYCT